MAAPPLLRSLRRCGARSQAADLELFLLEIRLFIMGSRFLTFWESRNLQCLFVVFAVTVRFG